MLRGAIITAAALVLAAIGAGIWALSGDDSTLADAAERIDGESMRSNLHMSFTDADGTYLLAGTGTTSADGSRGRMIADLTAEDEEGRVRMEMRNIGDEFWIRYISHPGLLPNGKRWVHSVDPTTAPQTLTPSEFARFLATADDVEQVGGDERVNGRVATRYRGTVDVQDVVEHVGGETRERYERLFGDRHRRLPVEAWIARDTGLPVRIRASAPPSGDVTVDILEYGVPVDVEPPPERTVIEGEDVPGFE